MKHIRKFLRKIPVQALLWSKWVFFVVCLFILILTLTEINQRLLVNSSSDNSFYTSWYTFRSFLVNGENPYGTGMQETVLRAAKTDGVEISQSSLYLKQPLYGIIIYLPFLFIRDFESAYAWWLTVLQFSAFFIVWLGAKLVTREPKKKPIFLMLFVILMMASLFLYTSLVGGAGSILSFLFLFVGILALRQGADELAGVLMALMTIFLFVGWVTVLFVLIWSFRQKRSKVAWWFIGTVLLLGFAVALLETQWLLYYLQMWVGYFEANPVQFVAVLLRSVFPATFLLPWFIAAVLLLLLLIEWALARDREFSLFYWTLHLTLVLEALLSFNPGPEMLVFLPTTLMLIANVWESRWALRGKVISTIIAVLSIGIPWVLNISMGEIGPVQNFLMILVPSVLVLVNLYWIRWWLVSEIKMGAFDLLSSDQSG